MTDVKTEINILAGPTVDGRLSHLLSVRGEKPGASAGAGAPVVIQSREALIYTLGKAAELEHLVLCQYLFSAFSMKRDASVASDAASAMAASLRWSYAPAYARPAQRSTILS